MSDERHEDEKMNVPEKHFNGFTDFYLAQDRVKLKKI